MLETLSLLILMTIAATFVIHGLEMRRRYTHWQDMARRRRDSLDDAHHY